MEIKQFENKTYSDVLEKVRKNNRELDEEKQLIYSYIIELVGLIKNLDNQEELKAFAIMQIQSYLRTMISRVDIEKVINKNILDFLDNLEFKDSFVTLCEYPLVLGFIRILEKSYFDRVREYNAVIQKYYNMIIRNILIKNSLYIQTSDNLLTEDDYSLMLEFNAKK